MAQMGMVEEEEGGASTKGEDIVMDTVVSASPGYNNQPFLWNCLMIVQKRFFNGYRSRLILKLSHSVWSY